MSMAHGSQVGTRGQLLDTSERCGARQEPAVTCTGHQVSLLCLS